MTTRRLRIPHLLFLLSMALGAGQGGSASAQTADLVTIFPELFAPLSDNRAWSAEEETALHKLIGRTRTAFRPGDLERWSQGAPPLDAMVLDGAEFRGHVFHLVGHVTSLHQQTLTAEEARRYGLDRYWRCRMTLADSDSSVLLFSPTVPLAWQEKADLNQRAEALGIFLKTSATAGSEPCATFLAGRIAWHPDTPLGNLGMDVGLLGDVLVQPILAPDGVTRSRLNINLLRLTERDHECFYQMLDTVGRSAPGRLRQEAQEALDKSGEEQFSVIPLFHQPQTQQGQLVKISGSARRLLLVRVADEAVIERFGIDHYYQLYVFTKDSQANPLVFCLREIPDGMPTGDGPRFSEHVTVAGFFLKTWAYREQGVPGAVDAKPDWQLAPLLIGRDLVWHEQKADTGNPWLGLILGLVALVVLGTIWLVLWRLSRSDHRFERKISRDRFGQVDLEHLEEE